MVKDGNHYLFGDGDARGAAGCIYGDQSEESVDKVKYGAGMIVHMARGKGEVISAATCEWVMGLKRNDFYTMQITRNILERFTRERS